MKRYMILPAAAATIWAQQAAPSAGEKALRTQVEKYYQLMMDKRYREAEQIVAEESKEDYYTGKKPDVRGFEVLKTELTDDAHAVVTIKAKQLVLLMGHAQMFEIPSPTYWKLEDGEWRWYVPAGMKRLTPFGVMSPGQGGGPSGKEGQAPGGIQNPDIAAIQGQLKADRTAVTFTRAQPEQSFTISNDLPGPADLIMDAHVGTIKGLKVVIEKLHLEAHEKSTVKLIWTPGVKVADEVVITASPINSLVAVKVESR